MGTATGGQSMGRDGGSQAGVAVMTHEGWADELAPADPLMAIAWRDCLLWAIGSDGILAAFRAETGNRWSPGLTPAERMIDGACGADARFAREFVAWFNANVWGETGRAEDDGDGDGDGT